MKSKFVKAGIIVAGFWCGAIAHGADRPVVGNVYQSGFEQVFNEENAGTIAPVGGTNACAAPATSNCCPPANAAGCGPAAVGCNGNKACGNQGCQGGSCGCGVLSKCSLTSLFGGCKSDCPEEEKEAWALQSLFTDKCGQNWLDDKGLKIGGSTVQSFTINFSSPRDQFNGPVTWTDRSNEYQLNQQWLYLEKATKTDDCKDWDLGGRVDLLLGTNARFATESNFEDKVNTDHSFYGLAVPSMYVELAYKTTKTKIGRFISPVGYNTVDLTLNPFNTIPYSYQYGQPFTHTGIWTTWQATEALNVGGGVIRGWDNFGQQNPNAGFMGTATYTINENQSLAFVNFYTQEPSASPTSDGFTGRYLQTLVYSHKFAEKYTFIGESDIASQDNQTATTGTAQWYSLLAYLSYAQSDKTTWTIGGEWFHDEAGVRVGGFLPNLPNTTATSRTRGLDTARSGFVGDFYQITMGPRYQFNKNVYIRPNLRVDWYGGDANGAGLLPYGDGTKREQGILGTDLGIVY